MKDPGSQWTIGQCAEMACLLECLSPKPGNVHRGADFEDLSLLDFATSAVGIGKIIDAEKHATVGELVERSVESSFELVQTNTNLGICLLIAPLVHGCRQNRIEKEGVREALSSLTKHDAACVYRAIQLAQAGGLGKVENADVNDTPPDDLIEAMALARDRDLIARQYVNSFEDLFSQILPEFERQLARTTTTRAIVLTHLWTMARFPDSLIARKCGQQTALQAAAMAQNAYDLSGSESEFVRAASDLDFWLRADGNRRNPGTTADLVCAVIFVALVNGTLKPRFT